MIQLNDVTCRIGINNLTATILERATATLPTDKRFVILGHYGSGKSSLIRLLAGLIDPDSGTIKRHARVSFPVGYGGGLKGTITVRENVAFVSELYGADPKEVITFVEQVAGLGDLWDLPLRKVPGPFRVRLTYTLSYAIPFDVYLVDNMVGMGDPEFRAKCEAMFETRAEQSGFILTTRHARYAKRFAEAAGILYRGRLWVFDNVDEAISAYEGLAVDIDDVVPENSGVDAEVFSEPT